MNYKILYYLDSDTHFLSEIKDETIKSDDKSKIYYWILYDKYSSDIIKLDFVSMSENKRVFKQGELTFNGNTAILKLNNNLINFVVLQKNKTANNILINILANDILEKNK